MSSKGAIDHQIAIFLEGLKNGELKSPRTVAVATANLLMRFVSSRRYIGPDDLVNQVKELGRRIIEAQPRAYTAGNIVRRVLKSIRTIDEGLGGSVEDDEISSAMFGLLTTEKESKDGQQHSSREEKIHIMDEIQLILEEVQNEDPLIKAGSEMISEGDILLITCPDSETVMGFLCRIIQKTRFSVILIESYPNETEPARRAAQKLERAGIPVTVIPDSVVYAIMSRVSKVLISCRAVLANGGCITSTGMALACQAATEWKKPVLAMAGSYKLSSLYPFDIDNLIEMGNSDKVIDFADPLMGKLEVNNPVFDYVAPELIDILITNDGSYSPNFVYRLILDNYSTKDQDPMLN